GRILVTPEELAEHGVVAAAQLLDVAPSPAEAIANAAPYLTRATSQVLEGA
ncbi:MAG: glycerate kinase, partial [Arthrobacter sp.]|nr:glycerate kinase [Arthrobacter sp.]